MRASQAIIYANMEYEPTSDEALKFTHLDITDKDIKAMAIDFRRRMKKKRKKREAVPLFG